MVVIITSSGARQGASFLSPHAHTHYTYTHHTCTPHTHTPHRCIACNRPHTSRAYMVTAVTEHEHFTNQFPFWEVNKQVQALNCKVRPTSLSHTYIPQTRYYQLFYYFNTHKHMKWFLYTPSLPGFIEKQWLLWDYSCQLALPDQIKYYMVVCL